MLSAMSPLIRRVFRYSAFLPALLLGAWLVIYTQRQAARPPTRDDLISGAVRGSSDPFQIDLNLAPEVVEFEEFITYGKPIRRTKVKEVSSPHVIRVTSKRIEMPVFDTRKITTQPTPWLGDTTAATSARKGIEPWIAGFIDRLSRGIQAPAPAPAP